MKNKIIILLFLTQSILTAQDNGFLDNRHEIGVVLGGSNYIGDIGSRRLIWPNSFAAGGFYRFNFNRRISARINGNYANIKGNDFKSKIPFRELRGLKFTNDFIDGSLIFDYNFFDYDIESNNAFSPYVFVGFGMNFYKKLSVSISHVPNLNTNIADPTEFDTFITKIYTSTSGFHLPFGLGIKKKISYRLNLNLAFQFNYLFHDGIDFSTLTADDFEYDRSMLPEAEFTDEIERRNFNVRNKLIYGNPNNNDWVVFTQIGLSYSFGRGRCYCEDDFYRRQRRGLKRIF